jgi:hypothetical protein
VQLHLFFFMQWWPRHAPWIKDGYYGLRRGRARLWQRESDLRFFQAPIARWESDRLLATNLPVANAMNEKPHGRSMHRSRIQD